MIGIRWKRLIRFFFFVRLFATLSKPGANNERVIFSCLINTDPDPYTLPNQVKGFDMVAMYALRTEGTAPGLIVVSDMKGVTFSHMTKLGLLHLKKFFFYFQVLPRINLCSVLT